MMIVHRTVSAIVFLVILSGVALGQEDEKKPAGPTAAADPRQLWKFDTGG